MRFKGTFETDECEDCYREISHLDNHGMDETVCSGCSARRHQEFDKTPCYFCKKPMKSEKDVPYYNMELDEAYAHRECFEEAQREGKLSEEDEDYWSDDYY